MCACSVVCDVLFAMIQFDIYNIFCQQMFSQLISAKYAPVLPSRASETNVKTVESPFNIILLGGFPYFKQILHKFIHFELA